MKRTIIFTGIFVAVAFISLYVFNRLTSKRETTELFTEVKKGEFEIALTATGELVAEKSIEIKGPAFATRNDIRSTNVRIIDIIPEGTIVKKGDYVASLDKTELNNSLKDETEHLTTLKTSLEMKILDTAVVLNDLRNDIKNQEFIVEEAGITLANSKYEPPATIRQAEINLEKSKRLMDQKARNYKRQLAQIRTDISNVKYWYSRVFRRVSDLQEVLSGFTITAPDAGMVVYKKEWNGSKRKAGSMINSFDRVVAILPDLSSLLSRTFINEIDISKIKAGQNVKISIDAYHDKSFTGQVFSVANIGEKLPNTDEKVFEVQIRIDGFDPLLRPSMTTGNKIVIKTFKNAVFVPIECVQAGLDSIPFVYTKSGTKQIVLLGESNDKNIIIVKGLNPGTLIYMTSPEKPEKFRLSGADLVPEVKERDKLRKAETEKTGILGENIY